jgi:hypothetical protein
MIVEAKVKNYKALKGEHTFPINGKSVVIIGDTAKGKSSLLEMIDAHVAQVSYPKNPLTDGQQEGYTETVHEIDGVKYTISRTFKRQEDGSVKLSRFMVKSSSGGRYSQEEFLKTHLPAALNGGKFEYAKFFFEQRSPEARYKYLIDSIGGDQVTANNAKIPALEGERAAIGQQRSVQQTLWEQEGIFTPESAERDIEYYKDPKTNEAAIAAKKQLLDTRTEILGTAVEYNAVKDKNSIHRDLQNKNTQHKERIELLKQQLKAEKQLLAANEEHLSLNPLNEALEKELKGKIDNAKTVNEEIEKKANEAYDEAMGNITLFNTKRNSFLSTVNAFRKWQELDAEWKEVDQKIKDLREANKEIFKNKLPIPELTIGEIGGKETVLYKGREFNWDNLSKGETIKITTQIQNAINPNGDNFIIIPEAQSLGSALDEIIKECDKYHMQALIEYTERNEDL